MKVAVPTRGSVVDDHFGHCEYFTIFNVENNEVQSKERQDSPVGCGCKSNIASILQEKGVEVMLAGNMGQGAVNVLNASNISVVRGCSGDIDKLVAQWIDGKIKDQHILCDHHDCDNH